MSTTRHCSHLTRAAILAFAAVVGLNPVCAASPESEKAASATQQQVRFLGLQTTLPSRWQRVDPSSTMRLAQFVAPGHERGQSAELIFYYFGAGQGGTPEANIVRWRSQFQDADGAPPVPEVTRFDVSGMPVARVKLQGSYARGIGAGPGGAGKPNQTLLVALLQTPRGQVTIQLHGDTPLIDALEPEFDRMLRKIAPASIP